MVASCTLDICKNPGCIFFSPKRSFVYKNKKTFIENSVMKGSIIKIVKINYMGWR